MRRARRDDSVAVSEALRANCSLSEERTEWLVRLPGLIAVACDTWSLMVDDVILGEEVTTSWVAHVERRDGSSAVLKIPMPHFEADNEVDGLRFWNGSPTVRLFEEIPGAMLLEACAPGTVLRLQPELDQDMVIAGLLRELWQAAPPSPFRPLRAMLELWRDETHAERSRWPDAGLVREGLALFHELSTPGPSNVLLVTDLHAGNVLRARRRPWLVIDPKPFVGDPAYDATQHLINCIERVAADPDGTIGRFADLLELDAGRIRSWLFARLAAEARADWAAMHDVARRVR